MQAELIAKKILEEQAVWAIVVNGPQPTPWNELPKVQKYSFTRAVDSVVTGFIAAKEKDVEELRCDRLAELEDHVNSADDSINKIQKAVGSVLNDDEDELINQLNAKIGEVGPITQEDADSIRTLMSTVVDRFETLRSVLSDIDDYSSGVY